MKIEERLFRTRTLKGLSQTEAGKQIGINRITMSKFETGKIQTKRVILLVEKWLKENEEA